jgi:phytoene dehydrogenase-like protein
MHTPARVDPSLAPEGQDTLVVVVPVGHMNDAAPQDWAAVQKRARQLVLQRLAGIGADEHCRKKWGPVYVQRPRGTNRR